MKRILFAVLTMILCTAVNADVYRCTVNGKIQYQDHPCSSGAQKALDDRNAKARQRQQELATAARNPPPPEPIAWQGSFQQDILKVSALLDHIRVLGRDCEWELKVTPSENKACKAFMLKLVPGGDYVQIGTRIQELLQDDTNARQAMGELATIKRHFEDITRTKEFMMARMGR
ncbi:DUF4124 domain-containing protein [Ottowia testudinis]|uniref:DUF4124 domain-containing protein n=1 Tax=Ottowia testudinis TaxID=2816950 RepID=A0A975CJV7_9BURK|nr:DUF4124 domain-containing protein [Ottowia testudinis]QTD46342.1 DUF4124 domain-containing protein [Ottowia testudinis]